MIRHFSDLNDILIDPLYDYEDDGEQEQFEEYTQDFDEASPIKAHQDQSVDYLDDFSENEEKNEQAQNMPSIVAAASTKVFPSTHLNKLFPVVEENESELYSALSDKSSGDSSAAQSLNDASISLDNYPQVQLVATEVSPSTSPAMTKSPVASANMSPPTKSPASSSGSVPSPQMTTMSLSPSSASAEVLSKFNSENALNATTAKSIHSEDSYSPQSVDALHSKYIQSDAKIVKVNQVIAGNCVQQPHLEFRHATESPQVTFIRTHNTIPPLYSRVQPVQLSSGLVGKNKREEEVRRIQKESLSRKEVEEVVREVLLQKDVRNHTIENHLNAVYRQAVLQDKFELNGRKAIRVPSYDRYYEIAMEIQELIARERERERLEREQASRRGRSSAEMYAYEIENERLRDLLRRQHEGDDLLINKILGIESTTTTTRTTRRGDDDSVAAQLDGESYCGAHKRSGGSRRKKTSAVKDSQDAEHIAAARASSPSRPPFVVSQFYDPSASYDKQHNIHRPKSPLPQNIYAPSAVGASTSSLPVRTSSARTRASFDSNQPVSRKPAGRGSNKNSTSKLLVRNSLAASVDVPKTDTNGNGAEKRSLSGGHKTHRESYRYTEKKTTQSVTMSQNNPLPVSSSSPMPHFTPSEEEQYRRYLLSKLAAQRPEVAQCCDNIYSTFLADMIALCKQRSAESGTPEELAMHRVLSEHVAKSFAAQSIGTVQSDMVRSALDLDARRRK